MYITQDPRHKESNQRYRYAQYATWPEDTRYELVNGVPYMLAAPSDIHQAVVGELFGQLRDFLKGKPCKVRISPYDVRLFGLGDNEETVVQPDVLVVCDRSKLDAKGCNGAPDLVIEVVSPSTVGHDMIRKYDVYQKAGVREYWIVEPDTKMVSVNILETDHYHSRGYEQTAIIPVHVLEGCTINLKDVFPEEQV